MFEQAILAEKIIAIILSQPSASHLTVGSSLLCGADGQRVEDGTVPRETVALPVPEQPEAATTNTLDKGLQGSLRRSTYDFSRSPPSPLLHPSFINMQQAPCS